MYTDGFEQWTKLNKNLTGPFADWNKTTTEFYRKLYQQHLEIMGENMSRFSTQIKRFSTANKSEDLINIQKECLNEDIAASIQNWQKLIQASMQNIEEFSKTCGSTREHSHKKNEKSGE